MNRGRVLTAAALLLIAAGCSAPDSPTPPPATSAAPSASAVPTFTEVHRGATESVVKLRRYDPRARAVVVEPTIFLQGPDFCAAFRLPGTDRRCDLPWATEDSKVKVTLALSGEAELLSVGDGDAGCVDERTGAGTCKWSPAGLAGRAADDGDLLIRLTTRDGVATRLAEVFVP